MLGATLISAATIEVNSERLMNQASFSEIARVLREHQSFAVLSHVRPDGDALGSQLAMALALLQLGKKVRVWNEDGMLEKYSFYRARSYC